ncbi:MSCRAMM family protein [Halorubrum tibetense]|uniref:Collagen binding domain-containing protein n=1 Tax=Halorubrum tibetense TaxID=175631 RepID=A0ABD5S747_9EURY
MPSLRVYDTKGNEHSPNGGGGRTNDTVKDLFYDGVRLAIETGRERKFTTFFRARETRNARTEQFYAVYTARDATIREFMDALRDRIESEWGYTIDDSADDMSVFRALDAGRTSVPGDERDRSIVEELIGSRQTATVGVRDAEHALGLVSEFMGKYDRAAIADSPESSALSGFDLVIAPDGTRGIAPIGDTESRWESTKQSLRSQHIDQEIASINDSVQTLSREYNLSSSEIRSRVYQRVPALKSPNTGGSKADALAGSSGDDGLLSPAVGKMLFVGAVALIVLVAGAWGAASLGLIGGDEPEADLTTVNGTVYADAAGEVPAEEMSVTLDPLDDPPEGEDAEAPGRQEAMTGADGTFTVENVSAGNYSVWVDDANGLEYDDEDIEVTENETEIEVTPDRALISGEVVDAESGEPITTDGDGEVNATIELVDTSDESVDAAEGGSYEFALEGDAIDGEYEIRADAEGYEPANLTVDRFGEQDAIELDPVTMSLSGQVTNSSDGEPIENANVTLSTDAGQEFNATTDADGNYETEAEIPIGEHDVEVEADGYVTVTETVEFETDDVTQDFELVAEASVQGTLREEGDEEITINDARVTTSQQDEEVDQIRSDGDGQYAFDSLPPGEYTILVDDRNGYADKDVTIVLEAGETLSRDIELEFIG